MDIGLLVPLAWPYADAAFVDRLGRLAEGCGFRSLWVGEHVVMPLEPSADYPYAEVQATSLPLAVRHGELDPFSTLGFLAAVTRTIRLGACAVLPQRNPVYTAKEVANADWLSGGRVDLGVGVGWCREEFEAIGVSFQDRGRRCDSFLNVLRALWSEPGQAHRDDCFALPAVKMYPKPLQAAGVPVHVLGDSPAALRRAAQFGQGFFPMDKSPIEMAALLATLDTRLTECGRRRDDIRVSVCPYSKPCDLEALKGYRNAGVDEVVVCAFIENSDELEGRLEGLAEYLLQPAQAL